MHNVEKLQSVHYAFFLFLIEVKKNCLFLECFLYFYIFYKLRNEKKGGFRACLIKK